MFSLSTYTSLPRTSRLSLLFLLFSFLFASSAVVLIVVSQVWRFEAGDKMGRHALRNMVVGEMDLTAATVLGGVFLGVLVVGMLGFVQGYRPGSLQRREARGLIAFSWSLTATMISTLVVASIIWFFTLSEVNDFRNVWEKEDSQMQMFLQDKLKCCGYFNATTSGLLMQTTGFCTSFAQPGPGTNTTVVPGCMTPILSFGDFFLNNVFTTIYGFTAIQLALFLTTLCLIISRRDDERCRLVWEKAGGRSFV